MVSSKNWVAVGLLLLCFIMAISELQLPGPHAAFITQKQRVLCYFSNYSREIKCK